MGISEVRDVKVARWGNSLAVRLPQGFATEVGGAGSRVRFKMVKRSDTETAAGFGEGEQAALNQATPEAVVGKWGNSLGVRFPAEVASELGLKEGDMVTLTADGTEVAVARQRTREEALASFRKARGAFTGSVRFSREDLLLRGPDVIE